MKHITFNMMVIIAFGVGFIGGIIGLNVPAVSINITFGVIAGLFSLFNGVVQYTRWKATKLSTRRAVVQFVALTLIMIVPLVSIIYGTYQGNLLRS